MSRLADQLTDVKPIAFTDQLPLIFRGGGAPIPNMGKNGVYASLRLSTDIAANH